MRDTNRQLDLSAKFIQMGQALMEEGREAKNTTITLVGTNLIFLGGIVLSETDIRKFSELISMFSAKKLLDDMGGYDSPEFKKLRGNIEEESYEDIVSRLKALKEERENNNKEDDNEDEDEDNNEK